MNYNPYAAPQATPPQTPGAPQAGAPQPWEVGEVLARAWEVFKANWAVLVFSFLLVAVIGVVPGVVPSFFAKPAITFDQYMDMPSAYWGALGGSYIVLFAMHCFFETGLLRIQLAAARGQSPNFSDLFSGGSKFLPMMGVKLLLYIGLWIGSACLIVPAVLLYLGLWAAEYYVVDADLGVMDSLRASWSATKGQWGAIFLMFLLGLALWIGGYVACCIGVFVTYPLFELVKAIVFLRISGRGAAPQMAPQMGYGGPPPGGYGGPPAGGYGGPPGGAPPMGGGYGGPPPGAPPGGGGYGPPGGGGFGGPPPAGGGWPQR